MNATKEICLFKTYLENVQNRSDRTVMAYISALLEFCDVMRDRASMNDITRRDIESIYIAKLVGSGNCAASRAKKLSALRSFFRWSKENGIVSENPMDGVEMPKIPQKKPKVMSKEEVYDVLLQAKYGSKREDDYEIFRDFTILSLMFSTGVRRSELTGIKLSDVYLSDGSMLIHGKGNKERVVYYNDATKALLFEYINVHRKKMSHSAESEYLFVSRKDIKLCESTVNRIVNKYLEKAGLKSKGYTAHSTRKAFATMVYKNTGDLLAVQNLLGHASPTTTQRYVGVAEDSKRRAAMTVNF